MINVGMLYFNHYWRVFCPAILKHACAKTRLAGLGLAMVRLCWDATLSRGWSAWMGRIVVAMVGTVTPAQPGTAFVRHRCDICSAVCTPALATCPSACTHEMCCQRDNWHAWRQ
jgi:hypothetical protein